MPEEDKQVSDEAVETATKVIRNSIDRKEQEIDFFRSAFSVNQVVFSFLMSSGLWSVTWKQCFPH